jgi:hypothetical protein
VYSDNLIEVVEWCMALDPLSRPQSVFALQKELSREGERRYTKLSVGEKMRLQFDTMVTDTKKKRQARNAASAPSCMVSSPNEILGIPDQPQGRPRKERRPHGLLLHARVGPVCAGRRHGRPPRGEVAAQLALQTISALYQKAGQAGDEDVPSSCRRLMAAHHQIMRYASEKGMLDTPRTTLVAAVVQGTSATWVHCGDSRLYLVRDGELLVRTRDHSYLEQPPSAGVIRAWTASTATSCSPAWARPPSRCST